MSDICKAPKKIWLQWKIDNDPNGFDITWCADKTSDDDVEYSQVSEPAEVIPPELVDLVIFLAGGYMKCHSILLKAAELSTAEEFKDYMIQRFPTVQGTQNQMNLNVIGEKQYKVEQLNSAVNWLLRQKTV